MMKYNHHEDAESIALIQWAQMSENQYPALSCLYHIPNGGKRHAIEAARMKRMGTKKGVSDYHLPVARNGYHGLWIELKAYNGVLRPSQKEWLERMRKEGHRAEVCVGWVNAKDVLLDYLK